MRSVDTRCTGRTRRPSTRVLKRSGRGAGEVGVLRSTVGLHRVVEGVGQPLLAGSGAVASTSASAVAAIPDPAAVGVGDQEDRVLAAQARRDAEGLGAVGVHGRERRRILPAVDEGQEDAARSAPEGSAGPRASAGGS